MARRKTMTELEFKSLAAQGYNRIPLIAEAFADLETPLTLYLKLAQPQAGGKNTFLLESVVLKMLLRLVANPHRAHAPVAGQMVDG